MAKHLSQLVVHSILATQLPIGQVVYLAEPSFVLAGALLEHPVPPKQDLEQQEPVAVEERKQLEDLLDFEELEVAHHCSCHLRRAQPRGLHSDLVLDLQGWSTVAWNFALLAGHSGY